MKKNFVFLLTFLLVLTMGSLAQIEEEILQSKTMKIERGRAYLLEKFLDRDFAKVTEVKDYLLGLEDDNYLAFYPGELSLILMWTQEFDALTTFMRQIDSTYWADWRKKVLPKNQSFDQLFQHSMTDEHLLRFNIESADLGAEDKAFLSLYLDWFLREVLFFDWKKSLEINEEADHFLEAYPQSDYEWFVRNKISTKDRMSHRSNWDWCMGLDLCSGYVTGKLGETMTPNLGIGVFFDLTYKKLLMEIGYDILGSKTKKDQTYSTGIYEAGGHNQLVNFYLDAAYPVVSGKKWSVSPLMGIGGCWETYTSKQLSRDEIDELEKFCPNGRIGLILDYKPFQSYGAVTFRMKYHCGLSNYGGKFSAIHLISIGIAGML